MKKILTVLLVIPMLWVGVTWFTSSKTEEVFDQILMESNQRLADIFPFATVEKQSFTKGFTSSMATSDLIFHAEMFRDKKPVRLTMNHTIYHGPIMMTSVGMKVGSGYVRTTLDQVAFSVKAKQLVTLISADKEPIIVGMKMGVGDGLDVDLKIAPMFLDPKKFAQTMDDKVIPDNLGAISFAGGTGLFRTNVEASSFKGTLELGALEVKAVEAGKDISMKVAASIIEMDIDQLYKGSMLDGFVEMKIPAFSFSDGDATGVTFQGLSIKSIVGEEAGNFGGFTSFDVDKLLVKVPDMPVEFPESKLHGRFAVKGFAREDMLRLVDMGQKMRSSQLGLIGSNDNDQSSKEMMKSVRAYFAALSEMIRPGVETNNVMTLSNDLGQSTINFELSYIDSKKLFELETIRAVIMALKGQLKLHIDKDMIAGTALEEAVGMPVAMGFVVDGGEAYEAIVALNGGEVKINGDVMPILDMLGGMVDQTIPWNTILHSP